MDSKYVGFSKCGSKSNTGLPSEIRTTPNNLNSQLKELEKNTNES